MIRKAVKPNSPPSRNPIVADQSLWFPRAASTTAPACGKALFSSITCGGAAKEGDEKKMVAPSNMPKNAAASMIFISFTT